MSMAFKGLVLLLVLLVSPEVTGAYGLDSTATVGPFLNTLKLELFRDEPKCFLTQNVDSRLGMKPLNLS